MVNLYFLSSGLDYSLLFLGVLLAAAAAIPDPIATILIGKVFTSLSEFSTLSSVSSQFMSDVLKYCVGLWSLSLITLVLHSLLYAVWTYLGFRQGHHARKELYRTLACREASWFDTHSNLQGEILNSFKDIQDLELATGMSMSEVVSMITAISVQIAIAFYYSWAVTLVCLAGVPLLILITSLVGPCITRQVDLSKSLLQLMSGQINWVLSALPTVKIYQREAYEITKLRRQLYRQQGISIKYWTLFNLQQGAARFIVLSIFVQGFYFGSYMVRYHGLEPGSVVIVFWSILSAAGMLQVLMSHTLELQQGFISAKRLDGIFKGDLLEEADRALGKYPLNVSGEIRMEDVVFSYPSRSDLVLPGTSIHVSPGNVTYVVGHSGCGKSTLAALLSRQYEIQTGEITIDNHSIDLLSQHWIQNNVYVAQQHPHLFDISLFENVRIGARNPESVTALDVEAALMAVEALDFVEKIPTGLDTLGSYPFSGGERQRIALARAWLSDRPIAILDEPTSALEEQTQHVILSRIAEHRRGKTTIVITHNYHVIPEDQPVYVMSEGYANKFNSIYEAFGAGWIKSSEKSALSSDYTTTHVEENGPDTVPALEKTELHTNRELFRSIPHKFFLVLGMLIAAAHAIVNPLFAMVFSHLVMGIVDPGTKNITLWAMIVLVCAFCDGLTSFLKTFLNLSAEVWLRTTRDRIFSKLTQVSERREDAPYYSKLLASDSEKCALIITLYWPGLLSMFVLGVAGFSWALATVWKLTLVSVSLLPVFILITQLYKRESQRVFLRREKLRTRVIRLLTDISSGHRTLKSMGLERYFDDSYNSRERSLHSLTRVLAVRVGILHALVQCFPFVFQGLMIWFGMRMISRLESDVQEVLLVFSMIIFTMSSIAQLATTITSVGPGFEAAQRLMAAICAPDAVDDGNSKRSSMTELELRALSFEKVGISYESGGEALGSFTTQIEAGETVAITGPSGCGKSAIARMLMRLEAPSRGHIYAGGEDLQSLPLETIRREFGLVGQMPLDFFEGTIRENLWYAMDPDDLNAESIMKEVCALCGVTEFVLELEDDWDTQMKPNLLSGGQLQRLGIARTLMRQPQVLILDECTSALDRAHAECIKTLIRILRDTRRMTILVITHDSHMAAVADRTVMVDSSHL